jgi:hypothetical protein
LVDNNCFHISSPCTVRSQSLTKLRSTGNRLCGRFENMIDQIAWLQGAQNILGLNRLGESPVSNYQIFAALMAVS